MGLLSGTAVGSAVPSAVLNTADLVNNPVAVPATERYPGAVDPGQYDQAGTVDPTRGGPALGTQPAAPFRDDADLTEAGGGGVQDTAWTQGHDGPSVPWDSSAGEPFAPSGAIDPALHGEDTGGPARTQSVIGAAFGWWRRITIAGATNVNLASTQTTIGQTAPNGRRNLDQAQYNDSRGHDPWEIGYSERPILNNVAWQPLATQDGGAYTPAGQLPDMSPYSYDAQAYAAPEDPVIGQAPAAAAGATPGRWTIG